MQRPSAMAAVEKIEEKRKPEDFFGHRNRETRQRRVAMRTKSFVFVTALRRPVSLLR